MTEKEALLMVAVGDVCPRRDNPQSLFAHTASVIREADISFCQLETNLSERGSVQLHTAPGLRVHPRNVSALTYAGFQVVSFAGNHCLDWGEEAFFDTIDVLKQNKMAVIGVGKDIAEARKPAIIERKGTRVTFLAYNSVIPSGFQADINKSGCAPIRASTFYEQVDWQAGTPPRIISVANADDLEAMRKDIATAKLSADVTIVSMHWGVHFVPAMIAMYQREVGHAAIDAGADLVLGHHAHILKGVEVYKGKVIFYSMGNFAFDAPAARLLARTHSEMWALYGWGKIDMEYPTYGFPPDSRKTILVRCLISDKQIRKVSFLPVMINKQGQPEIMRCDDEKSDQVERYMEWLCQDQRLETKFSKEGNEVVIDCH